jgi:hypothetical protein
MGCCTTETNNEGADSGAGASVEPGDRYIYTRVADAAAGPEPADPLADRLALPFTCHGEEETSLGLIGPRHHPQGYDAFRIELHTA